MNIGTITICIHTPWVHSLKDKRRILKSLVEKTRQKFNVSISEIDEQDHHQKIVLGIAYVTNEAAMADRMIDQVLSYLEKNTDGEVFILEREFR